MTDNSERLNDAGHLIIEISKMSDEALNEAFARATEMLSKENTLKNRENLHRLRMEQETRDINKNHSSPS